MCIYIYIYHFHLSVCLCVSCACIDQRRGESQRVPGGDQGGKGDGRTGVSGEIARDRHVGARGEAV